MTTAQKRWLVAFAYVAFIYATVNVADIPLRYLRLHGLLRFFLVFLYGGVFAFLITRMVQDGIKEWWRYGVIVAVFLSYGVIASWVPRLEEQMHFLEYGLTGVFFCRALEAKWGFNRWVFIAALGIAGMCGWGDEFLQRWSPHRTYEVKDIILNLISAFLGLVIYRTLSSRTESAPMSQPARIRSSSIQQ